MVKITHSFEELRECDSHYSVELDFEVLEKLLSVSLPYFKFITAGNSVFYVFLYNSL